MNHTSGTLARDTGAAQIVFLVGEHPDDSFHLLWVELSGPRCGVSPLEKSETNMAISSWMVKLFTLTVLLSVASDVNGGKRKREFKPGTLMKRIGKVWWTEDRRNVTTACLISWGIFLSSLACVGDGAENYG